MEYSKPECVQKALSELKDTELDGRPIRLLKVTVHLSSHNYYKHSDSCGRILQSALCVVAYRGIAVGGVST